MSREILSLLLLSICTVGLARDVISKRSIGNITTDKHGERCIPGEYWKVECNSCFCSDKGLAFCTTRLCHVPPNQIDPSAPDCKPGSRWSMGCGYCFCSVDGRNVCDESTCINQMRTKRETEKLCQPNYHWDDGCNTFGCLPDGHWYSTEKLCPEKDYKKNVPMCERDARFTINNMNCRCNDQREVVCHERKKREVQINPFYCQPDYTWDDGCNKFACGSDGTQYSTKLHCGSDDYKKNYAICEKGAKFLIKGMKCYCKAGRGICKKDRTKRSLITEMGKTIFCQPGYQWNDGCNNQGCGENGIMYTSAKLCPESEINKNVRICEKGATWTFENRACHCGDKGHGVCAPAALARIG